MTLVELLGPRAIVTVAAGEVELTAVAEVSRARWGHPGAPVSLQVRPDAAHFFDHSTGKRIN